MEQTGSGLNTTTTQLAVASGAVLINPNLALPGGLASMTMQFQPSLGVAGWTNTMQNLQVNDARFFIQAFMPGWWTNFSTGMIRLGTGNLAGGQVGGIPNVPPGPPPNAQPPI